MQTLEFRRPDLGNTMQRKIESFFGGFLKGLLGLLGLAVALVAAYYVYTGIRKEIKDQQVIYEKEQVRFQLKDDTPAAIALVKTRYPGVEAECDRRIKLYSDSFFASVSREMRSWRVTSAGGPPPRSSGDQRSPRGGSPSGWRIYTVSYECASINKTLDTVDIEPLKAGVYVLRTNYRVDLNQNKILEKNADALLKTLGQSAWYQKKGT